MKRIIAIGAVVGVLALALLSLVDSQALLRIYDAKLQTPLFTGFLTLGGFLLTLKTGLLMRLKSDLYDNGTYRKQVVAMNNLAVPGQRISVFGPLQRLGSFLIVVVLMSLGTSVSQLTIGFIPSKLAAMFCLALAAVTISLVFAAWIEIRNNLQRWFSLLEEEAAEQPRQ